MYFRLVENLILALDDIRTQETGETEYNNYVELRILEVLNLEGIIRDPTKEGDLFDPGKHDVIGSTWNETIPENAIVKVAHSGYKQKDKFIKKSGVIVNCRGNIS
jgi:molecular chaperone GrpE (heat shock protein)